MKLKSVNKNIEKYGYPIGLEYDTKDFNGHQVGIAICVQNDITSEVEENYLSESLGDKETRDFMLGELLREEKAKFIIKNITQVDVKNKQMIPKTIVYMPYFVEDHSRFKPTVINKNIINAYNVQHEVLVEVVFVDTINDDLCRYITIPLVTRNMPVFESVYNFFNEDENLQKLGIVWQEETYETEEGYALDFYDESGEKCVITFKHASDLRDTIVSMRIIEMKRHIDGEDEYGDKSE